MVATSALALFLRIEGLGRQSLWADEGNSWGMVGRSLGEIAVAAAADIHPPLYYFLLHAWAQVFGSSEAALRSLSALFGVITVIVVHHWARRLGGRWAGAIAALLAAVSPFSVYYSQEARAYALMALLAALAYWTLTEYLLARDEGRRGRIWLIAHVLAAAALLWTHYLGFIALALCVGVFAPWAWRRPGAAPWREWLVAQAAIAILYLPWVPTLLNRMSGWPAISDAQPLWYYLSETVRNFAMGPSFLGPAPWAWLVLLAPLAGLLLAPWRSNRWPLWLLLGVAVLLPGVGLWLLSLLRPAYRAKFLLLGLPPFHVLAGLGVVWAVQLARARLHPVAGLALGAILIAAALPAAHLGLQAYRMGTGAVRDDYRGLAAYLGAAAGPEDAIVLNAPGQVEVFSYYYQGSSTVYPLPRTRPADPGQIEEELLTIGARHPRVYSVLWATGESDPERVTENWLDRNLFKASDVWYGNVRLTEHESPKELTRRSQAGVTFGGAVELAWYSLPADAVVPGQAVPVELTWQLVGPAPGDISIFIQALDANSNIVGQRDTQPVAGREPVSTWQPGDLVLDREAVPVLLGTPPGMYTLVLGLYDTATGARLTLEDGSDHLVLGSVSVGPNAAPIAPAALRLMRASEIGMGPLRLMGWDLAPLGGRPAPAIEVPASAPLSVIFYWRVAEASRLQLEFLLEGQGQTVVIGTTSTLGSALDPASWTVGQIYRDPHIVFLPGDLAPGEYRLSVHMLAGEGQGRVDLGRVTVPGS